MNEWKLQPLATVHISDLRLRTIIGINDWEREKRQEIRINITLEFDCTDAVTSDRIEDTVDYKAIKNEVVAMVEHSTFGLVERCAHDILARVMKNGKVRRAAVRVDKPFALRFADSVSVEMTGTRNS